MEQVRIDKWLWAARFYKTRSLATDAVLGGHVQLNGARVKPSKDVRAGDSVELRIGTVQWSLVVAGLSDRRGPASAARLLYEETPDSIAAREEQARARRLARPLGADLGARPTKQDRRRLDALRRAERKRPGP
jgi:ribosome-associated heat shock protein Hsp15